jgi:hypothetical protein
MAERNRNFNNDALSNNALSDVEKFLFLLSDLKIIDADKTESKTSSSSIIAEPDEPIIESEPSIDPSESRRSPVPYDFSSLLDELPFLQNIPSVTPNKLDEHHQKDRQDQESQTLLIPSASSNTNSLDIANSSLVQSKVKSQEEADTINLIQDLFLQQIPIKPATNLVS